MENTEVNVNQINNDEEISLIDLFAVLIRYRKLIVIGTAVITFLAGLYLFVLPKAVKSMDKRNYDVTYRVKVNNIPGSIFSRLVQINPDSLKIDATSLFITNMNNPVIVKDVYNKHKFLSTNQDKAVNEYDFNLFIQNLLKEKKFEIKNSIVPNVYEIHSVVPVENVDVFKAFVLDILNTTEKDLQENIPDQLEVLKVNLNNQLKDLRSSFSQVNDVSAIQDLQTIIQVLNDYASKLDSFVTLQSDPFIVPVAQGRVKTLAIAMFASLFIFIFIAFAMNAVANIKADKDAMKTITDAWVNGR